MYKYFLTLLFAVYLHAEIMGGVAVVVKGEAITVNDVKKEMRLSNTNAKKALDILIRKKLEELEIKERGISVTSGEVYDDIKQAAARNGMSVSEFYEAIRNSNGLSSSELKEKIKTKLESQKLYSAIAYSNISQPTEDEIKEYYELNKEKFSHPSSFKSVIYASKDPQRLQEKIDNPMLYSPDINTNEQELPYDRIPPELASLLESTPVNSFTKIVSDGKGGYMSFYIKEVESSSVENGIEGYKNKIINMIMSEQREQVLGDYFAMLKHQADINIIRMP